MSWNAGINGVARDAESGVKHSELPGDSLLSTSPPCSMNDMEMPLSSSASLGGRRLKDLDLTEAATNAAPCWVMVESGRRRV